MTIGDVIPKKLFQGYLSTTITALYTAPPNIMTQIVDIHIVNQNSTTDRKISIYAHGTASGNQINRNITVLKDVGICVADNKIILNSGEVLAMTQDIGTDVLVTIYGCEEVVL